MVRPGKPMAKNSNSKYVTRNNKQDIFSQMGKATKQKLDAKKQTLDVSSENTEKPE